jgi:hypothetical protein
MKLRLTAAVEGVLELPLLSSSIMADRQTFTFSLESDQTKCVTRARVTIAISADEVRICKNLVTHPPAGSRLDVVVPPKLYEEAIQQLQLLESNLSFCFSTAAVTRLRWDEPTIDLLPENEPEEALVNTWSIHVERKYPEPPARLSERDLQEIVTSAPKYDSLGVGLVLKPGSQSTKPSPRLRLSNLRLLD